MENVISIVQFWQVLFMIYLFYEIIDLKSTKKEIFVFWLLLTLFMLLKLWIIPEIFNLWPWSNVMELLWGLYNCGIYLYMFIYLKNNYEKN